MARRKQVKKPLLSLIIPAYKQEKTIIKDLRRIKKIMDFLERRYEIIVVVDGIVDKTYEKAKKIRSKKIKIVAYSKNRGKGFAVRHGMSLAKGDVIAFIDAGMDINPKSIDKFLKEFERESADVLIGSKLHPDSKVNYPGYRRILSLGYRLLVKILFGLSVKDTQVGLKFFKKEIVEKLLPRLLVKEYAFDIELLVLSHYLGYKRIYEFPVKLKFNSKSTIVYFGFWKVIMRMLWDTFAVFYRLKILKYYNDTNKKNWKKNSRVSII